MLAIDQGTKAYVAGVLDMAGIIRTRKAGDALLPYVGLSTPNKQVADFIAGLTDAKVTVTKRQYNKMNCTEHCTPDAHTHVDSVSFRWSVTGAKATVLLANIKPYMIFKRTEVLVGLETGRQANFKPATFAKMRALGWEIPEDLVKKESG